VTPIVRAIQVLDEPIRAEVDAALALLAEDQLEPAYRKVEFITHALGNHSLPSHLIGLISLRAQEAGKALEAFLLAHQLAPEVKEHAEILGILYAKLGHVADSLYFGKLSTATTREFGIDALVPAWFGTFLGAFFKMQDQPLLREAERCFNAGDFLSSMRHFRQATQIDRDAVAGWRGLAISLLSGGRAIDALAASTTLVALRDRTPADLALHGEALLANGDYDAALEAQTRAAAELPDDPNVGFALIRTLVRRPSSQNARLIETAAAFAARFDVGLAPPPRAGLDALKERRFRLGVVSTHWRTGEGLDTIVPVIERFDARHVELFVYAEDRSRATLATRLRNRADAWRDIEELDDDTLSFLIRNDALDVLIDLDGTMLCTRPVLFLARPAALTLSLYGLPEIAGALGFDGVVGDAKTFETVERAARVTGGVATVPFDLPQSAKARLPTEAPIYGLALPFAAYGDDIVGVWHAIRASIPGAMLRLTPASIGGASELAAIVTLFGTSDILVGDLAETLIDHFQAIDVLLVPPNDPMADSAIAAASIGVIVIAARGPQPRTGLVAGWLESIGLARLIGVDHRDMSRLAIAVAPLDERAALRQQLESAVIEDREQGAKGRASRLLDALMLPVLTGNFA
jgi:tetratricopeptide (TPR) repeat protein